MARESQLFWTKDDNPNLKVISHWRGQGVFQDDQLWQRLGLSHVRILERAASWTGFDLPCDRIIEWGCGGGMNAVHLAKLAHQYIGVDINRHSLEECGRQLASVGAAGFLPIHVRAESPDTVIKEIPGPCDVFISTYVFEALPNPAYGVRLMKLARRLLGDRGLAIVHIRYHTGHSWRRMIRRRYAENWVTRTTYGIDEFWTTCSSAGFDPLFVQLVPELPALGESRYAFFAMSAKRDDDHGTSGGAR